MANETWLLLAGVGTFVLAVVYRSWPSGAKAKIASALPSVSFGKNDLASRIEAADRKAKADYYAKVAADIEELINARLALVPKADVAGVAAPVSTPETASKPAL